MCFQLHVLRTTELPSQLDAKVAGSDGAARRCVNCAGEFFPATCEASFRRIMFIHVQEQAAGRLFLRAAFGQMLQTRRL